MGVNTLASKRSELLGNEDILRMRRVIHNNSTCVCLRIPVAAITQKRKNASVDLWPALDVEYLMDDKPQTLSNVKISEELDPSAKMESMELIKACPRVEVSERTSTLFNSPRLRVKPYPILFFKVSPKEIENIIRMGVILPYVSPYYSPLLLFKKPDGSNRLVVDFRQLLRATILDAEPMINPKLIFENISRDQYFDNTYSLWRLRRAACASGAFYRT